MTAAATPHEWAQFLRFFGGQSVGGLTRPRAFEPSGNVVSDYGSETSLPVKGIAIDTKKNFRRSMVCKHTYINLLKRIIILTIQI